MSRTLKGMKKIRSKVPSIIAADEQLYTRPGFERLHTFRSQVKHMTAIKDGRLIVLLASGKGYISNKKHTRWNRIAPEYLPPVAAISNGANQ